MPNKYFKKNIMECIEIHFGELCMRDWLWAVREAENIRVNVSEWVEFGGSVSGMGGMAC